MGLQSIGPDNNLLDSAKIVCSLSVLKIKLRIMVNHTAVYYVCIQQTSTLVFYHAISHRPSITQR